MLYNINPYVKFYNHEKIKKIFEDIIDNSNIKFIKSRYTTDIFFRTEMSYENNILIDIKKEFNGWVDEHNSTDVFEIFSGNLPLVKSHNICDTQYTPY